MGAGEGNLAVSSRTFYGSKFLFYLLVAIHVIWFGLGVAKIVIGAMYINDCDREPMIPIWLIVDAIIPLAFVIGFVPHYKEDSSMKKLGLVCLVIAIILSIGWSVCGAVAFIYPNWNKEEGNCDTVVAKFSFAAITINWCIIWMWSNLAGRMLYFGCR
ncbi:uncharacterized protein LOC123531259 [Mercenaria mercenaria]|uniref:uncharacterized protein LOC123531259 n=1 Tax=Mercenaria mercenaria TaxID=6596 RepID=UPI00234F1352|nr:uncharacterized protein LOC123531259 [Mercenaria mercenaria]XP_053374659.1 uncharacterized protein LOC123531259 [Mercenaria mercenaria]